MSTLAPSRSSPGADLDPAAPIAELFDEHCDFVCRVLRHHGVRDSTLDDAVQDVFVTAYRRWSSFEGRSSARSWLYGIARRIAHRYRRSAATRARHFVDAAPTREPDHEPFARAHAAASLDALLERIDRDKRTVFVLSELEGMTAPEIADALAVPVGTVYSRLRAAWQGLGREAEREQQRLRRQLARATPEGPSDDRRRRMWGLVATGVAPLSRSAPASLTATAGWLAQLKWLGVGAAIGAGLIGARLAIVSAGRSTDDDASPSASSTAIAERREPGPRRPADPSTEASRELAAPPEVAAAAEATPPAEPPPREATTKSVRRSATPPFTPPTATPSPDALAIELALMQRAQQALLHGRHAEALDLLDQHAREHPRGQLLDERRTARLKALCALDRRPEAAREAQALGRDPAHACP